MGGQHILSGGVEVKKSLQVLAEVLEQSTKVLIEKGGPIVDLRFLDLGCGGGNASLMVARMVGEKGHIIGVDFDKEIINLARQDAQREGVSNVVFESNGVENISFFI